MYEKNTEYGERDREQLARNIARIREIKGMTQEQLAQRAGLSRGTIAGIETGGSDPGFSTLKAISRALGCSLEDFSPYDEIKADEITIKANRRELTMIFETSRDFDKTADLINKYGDKIRLVLK